MSSFSGMKLFVHHINAMKHVCRLHGRFISRVSNLDDESELLDFTSEQQEEIMESLYKCVRDNTTRVNLSNRQLQNLKPLFQENPNLKNVELLLSVSGFGPKTLHNLCDSILREGTEQQPARSGQSSSFVTPSRITQTEAEKVVGIHIGVNGISWACLRTDESAEVEVWDIMDLSENINCKYDVHSVWQQAVELRNIIPNGDVYVMENSNWSNTASVKKPMKFHIQQAMLTSAICSVFNLADLGMSPRQETDNRLYFLNTYVPSRLFRKIVGSERVSALDVVENMIAGSFEEWHQPVTFSPDAVIRYTEVNGPLKDNLSQGLLLVVSFVELVMLRNPSALKILGKTPGGGLSKKATS